MISRLSTVESRQNDPYRNLALEEQLLSCCGEDECILYLWQNERSVVIGRNQDPWRECRVAQLEENGGHLVRRLSGGGAVYHDLGNLNYSFIALRNNYDTAKQTEIVCLAMKALGIEAGISGRNDITVGNRKFSGSAYYERGDRCCHHGTIMLSVDLNAMERYLTASDSKLTSKGIASVRARVANLLSIVPDVSITDVKRAMVDSFEHTYGRGSRLLDLSMLDSEKVKAGAERFRSHDWIFGKHEILPIERVRRFSWGEVIVRMCVSAGQIDDIALFSDAMDADWIQTLQGRLKGSPYTAEGIRDAIGQCHTYDGRQEMMKLDLIRWMPVREEDDGWSNI